MKAVSNTVVTRTAAVLLGVLTAFVLLLVLFSDAPGTDSFRSFVVYVLGYVGVVVLLHAALGLAFGFVFPRTGWHWGPLAVFPHLSPTDPLSPHTSGQYRSGDRGSRARSRTGGNSFVV